MKKNPRKHLKPRRRITRKGIALITVLSLLAITTLLIAAFFSLAKVELISSDTYANGIRSRQLADTAVNISMSQVKKATVAPAGTNSIYYAWASQPGAIRKYDTRGNFYEAYKLYSDNNMVVDATEGERSLVEDSPPEDWENQPERYVDLNSPVIRRSSGGDFDERFYPILDPRAAQTVTGSGSSTGPAQLAPIQGFSYTNKYLNGVEDDQVILPTGSGDFDKEADAPHIPMPVEWLYVLQDGTVGYLAEGNGEFVGQGPKGTVSATEDNPITGRIAFWTDDECAKININTASEPTFWNVPWLYSDIDYLNAMRQPARREYQRYPGHPATTALSPVLFPDMYDGITPSTGHEAAYTMLRDRKELIYGMVPRIGPGGSESGTAAVSENPTGLTIDFDVQPIVADDDRLYSSLDELIFDTTTQGSAGATERVENPLLDSRTLQRAQFFLTANSSAPETNLFNMPRIGIWPIHRQFVPPDIRDDKDDGTFEERYGTGFDSMMLFCSTLGGVPYFFMREDADDPFHDLLPSPMVDNFKLFHGRNWGYLWNMVQLPFPGYSRAFVDKYGESNTHQIITEIFDYIRCTNLHDDLVASNSGNEGGYVPENTGTNENGTYKTTNPLTPIGEWFTFTDPRSSNPVIRPGEEDEHYRAFPGHGQVTPIQVPSPAGRGQWSRGMGRFFTISEATLHFICGADGNPNAQGHGGVYRKGSLENGSDKSKIEDHLTNNFANWIGAKNNGGFQNPQTDPMKPEYKPQMVESPGNLYNGPGGVFFGGAAAPNDPNPYKDEFNQKKENDEDNTDPVESYIRPQSPDGKFWYSGFPPIPDDLNAKVVWANAASFDAAPDAWKDRTPGSFFYNTKNPDYPGYDPTNWNHNLASVGAVAGRDRTFVEKLLLKDDERLVQCMLNLETFCPSLGYTQVMGAMYVRITGLDKFTLNGKQLFPAGDYWLASQNMIDGGQRGGANGARAFVRSKNLPGRMRRDDDGDVSTLPNDANWEWNKAPGTRRDYVLLPVVSDIITVEPKGTDAHGEPLMEFQGGIIKLEIFAGRDRPSGGEQPVQEFEINMDGKGANRFVQPQLVMYGTPRRVNSRTGATAAYASEAPFWWTFNRNGCYGLRPRNATGRLLGADKHYKADFGYLERGHPSRAQNPTPLIHRKYGRVIMNDTGTFHEDGDKTGSVHTGDRPRNGSLLRREDTIQSMLPWHGDYRHVLAAGDYNPRDPLFVPHIDWGREQHAHNLIINRRTNTVPGFARTNITMMPGIGKSGVPYRANLWPDWPQTGGTTRAQYHVALLGDFDTGFSDSPDGPYINKPDEGDTRIRYAGSSVPYMVNNWAAEAAGPVYFSPNRQVPSPGMFGSLSSGIKGGPYMRASRAVPWMTLLFRPPAGSVRHPGERDQPKPGDLPDHLLLDLFWMPVVEPYAISEPLSTAGKVNLNYQILPFTNIRRATAMHAVMKSEKLLAYHKRDTLDAKRRPNNGRVERAQQSGSQGRWWDNTQKRWWRDIDVDETLRQLEDPQNGKFSKGEIFRSASEICELNMVPVDATVRYDNRNDLWKMYEGNNEFYMDNYKVTGENARERPYANIYPRVTTKSNTFQVHYRVQTIQKSNFTEAKTFVADRDGVKSEFRGSTIFERYIDPNDPDIPDYRQFRSKPEDTPPLDKFYRYRIVSNKRFAP